MRAFVQCSLARAIFTFAAALSGAALALQPVADPEEEIIIRGGKPLSQYRLELKQSRDELFKLFNELNEGQDTDVQCRDESQTGSRIPQSVCRSHAEDRADAAGARDFLNALVLNAGKGRGGPQINGGTGTSVAMSDAMTAGARALVQFEQEWRRVLGENQLLYEAVLKHAELEEEFDRIRGEATGAPAQQPRQIVLGPAGPQCEASTLTEFQQRGDVVRVSGRVSISICPAGTTGSFTLVAEVREATGEARPLEFMETWQRADAQDHVFNADYPIGGDVTLASLRVRGLRCTCEDPAQ